MSAAIPSESNATEISLSQAIGIPSPTPIVPPGDILPIWGSGGDLNSCEAHGSPPGSGTGHGLDEHPHEARTAPKPRTSRFFPPQASNLATMVALSHRA